MVFAHYVERNAVMEQFLLCKPLETTPIARNIFNLVKSFFCINDTPLQAIGSICTDGAPAMLGNWSKYIFLMKNDI